MDDRTEAEPPVVVRRAIELLRRQADIGPELEWRVLSELRRAPTPDARRRGWGHLAAVGGLALAATLAIIVTRVGLEPAASSVREIRFTLSAEAASRVALVGDFNDWDPALTPLRRTSPAGEWSVTLPLLPGSYRFSFLLDGRTWQGDPSRPIALDPDFGTPTSVITVEQSAL
ncbi:MAG TPA: isoamylase early set domain-containing protein [Gemmatimonadales bacterium]|nr:isoamylase early set domain-containing protein [Gemmatimonadales bacterium]